MKNWIKNKLGIAKLEKKISELNSSNLVLQNRLAAKESEIEKHLSTLCEFTKIDADVGIRGNNTIVLTGYVGKRGYVRFYDIGDGKFKELVEWTKEMQKYGEIRSIDEPMGSQMMKHAICGGWEL